GSVIGRLMEPVGSIYGNFVIAQDQDYDLALKTADAWMPLPMEVVDLQLWHDIEDEISLSWHLTAVERKFVLSTIKAPENQAALTRLKKLIVGEQVVKGRSLHGTPAAPEADRWPL